MILKKSFPRRIFCTPAGSSGQPAGPTTVSHGSIGAIFSFSVLAAMVYVQEEGSE